MTDPATIPLPGLEPLLEPEMLRRAQDFHALVHRRRTVRDFDPRAVPREVIAACIAAAGTAPSGANQQPWHFVVVSAPDVKRRIRLAAEAEEREFYERRAPEEWLDALRPIGTDWHKSFLETAPWLIAIFVQKWGRAADGSKVKHYYPSESVGIATGLLITALHQRVEVLGVTQHFGLRQRLGAWQRDGRGIRHWVLPLRGIIDFTPLRD